ncbi:hypothetical protein RRG08_032160 [Elysia crispata]|uniref:PiggyBac transposable element-derived protein domain-containing protein n=1 Tax=Elysia crispata TaxID=231223 RepID=A0AAE1ABY9_9GAST|nr:hypothetical protein RRG08_032160 [Elysia crispata]
MESQEVVQIIDLGDPQTLRELATEDNSRATPFISEFSRINEDSDIEEEEPDELPVRRRGQPIYRQALSIDGYDEDDDNESIETPELTQGHPLWREGTTPPNKPPFTGRARLQVEMESTTPLDYFKLMVSEDMVASMVAETDRYASQTLRNKELSPNSRFRKWVDVTIPEMYTFMGLILSMGLIVIDYLEDYWSTDSILHRSDEKRTFLPHSLIFSPLQLIPREQPGHDPIFKIRNFVDNLTYNFKSVFYPGERVAIDEAMVACRGPLSFWVFNPDKPDKFGIKVFELCDSSTAYCCNLEFYTGKQESSPHGAIFYIVRRLISPYIGCGRTLYVDNFYTSLDLFTYLKQENTLACGTMRMNRKHGPPKTMVPNLKKGDDTVTLLTNGQLNLIRFMDRKEVRLLTTAHTARKVATGKNNPVTKEPIVKFHAAHEYNQYMGAVDRSDQMVSYNAFKRRTLKWWKKAFFHLFMLGVLNAYIVQKATAAKKLTHRIFRRELAKQLLIPEAPAPPLRLPEETGNSSLFRLTARHFPKLIEPKAGAKRKNPQRDCAVCTQPEKRKQSRYECPCCNVGLHVDPCFRLYHTKKDFKRAHKRLLSQNPQPADDQV